MVKRLEYWANWPTTPEYNRIAWANYLLTKDPTSGVSVSEGDPGRYGLFEAAVQAGYVEYSAEGMAIFNSNMAGGAARRATQGGTPSFEEWLIGQGYYAGQAPAPSTSLLPGYVAPASVPDTYEEMVSTPAVPLSVLVSATAPNDPIIPINVLPPAVHVEGGPGECVRCGGTPTGIEVALPAPVPTTAPPPATAMSALGGAGPLAGASVVEEPSGPGFSVQMSWGLALLILLVIYLIVKNG